MSDQMKLSQDEIDALLNGGASKATSKAENVHAMLTPDEADTLGEIGNISFGSAATSLSTLLQHRVDITTPTVTVIEAEEIPKNFPEPYVLVAVEFTEGLKGSNALAIATEDAKTIADLMLGGDGTNTAGELNELHLSAVGEAMNQMMGGAATSMSQMFGRYINISPPKVQVIDLSSIDDYGFGDEDQIVNVQFQLRVGELINSRIMQLLPLGFARAMVHTLMAGPVAETAASSAASPQTVDREPVKQPPASPTGTSAAGQTHVTSASAEIAAARNAYASAESPRQMPKATVQPIHVQQPEFVDFDSVDPVASTPRNLSLLYDVPLNVTVELGRAKKAVREVLELSPGSILELDKLAGEPVDILINNKRIAIGEVVVIDENFGVRVTDIISADQRVGKLS